MRLTDTDKYALLQKTADIAIQAADSGKYDPASIVDLLEKSYDKLIDLAGKE